MVHIHFNVKIVRNVVFVSMENVKYIVKSVMDLDIVFMTESNKTS